MFKGYKNKGFWGGEHGHVHGLQEFGVWAALVGLSTWLVSPFLGLVLVALLMLSADKYWIKREVKQSIAQGRKHESLADLVKVPNKPNRFWTADAIADVLFPRKLRKVWLVLSVIYITWALFND